MAGHSHWAGIKHKKGVVDAKRGKIFSKYAKHISTAARNGGGDPDMNLKLKYAIEKARQANMPKENIERAIKSGTGELPGQTYEEITYEGYGPGGVAILMNMVTDNRNRTAAEIRKLFETKNGSLAQSGSVAWQFETRASIVVPGEGVDEEKLLEVALEAGADNMTAVGGIFEITGPPEVLEPTRSAAEVAGYTVSDAEITRVPQNKVALESPSDGKKIIALLLALEDHDDVQNVYTNYDVPEDLLAQVEGR